MRSTALRCLPAQSYAQSYLSMSDTETAVTSTFAPYRQHEVREGRHGGLSVPLQIGRRLAGPVVNACLLACASHPASLAAPLAPAQVAIPMSRAATCLAEVGKEVYGPGKLWEGEPVVLYFAPRLPATRLLFEDVHVGEDAHQPASLWTAAAAAAHLAAAQQRC